MENDERPRIAVARNYARKLLKDSHSTTVPIFLNAIIQHLNSNEEHRLYIQSWDFGDNVSGIIIFENDFSAIGYNESQHVHRNRFTVAHEIGHLMFGHVCQKNSAFTDERNHEKEANQFAAELLMPLALIKQDLISGIKDVPRLAQRYWVSKEAVGWRIADPYSKLLRHI